MSSINCSTPPQKENRKEFLFLSDESKKDKPWDTHRSASKVLASIFRGSEVPKLKKHAIRLDDCSPWLAFGVESNEKGEKRHKISQAFFCHVRTCPVCQWRRSLAHKARFLRAMPAILSRPECRGAKFMFLTLTVRNCDVHELRTTIQMMNDGWRRLHARLSKKPWLLGWVLSTEVTRSDSEEGNAHPHFHILLMVKPSYFKGGNYITQSEWIAIWKQSARLDYDPSVRIELTKGHRSKRGVVKTALEASASEVLKYATSFDEELLADPEWVIEYAQQIHALKFVRTGGLFSGILKEDYTTDEMLQGEEEGEEQEDKPLPLEVVYWFSHAFNQYARPRKA